MEKRKRIKRGLEDKGSTGLAAAPRPLTPSLSAGQSVASAPFERCQRGKEEEEEEGGGLKERRRKKGVRHDECSAAVDLQRLQKQKHVF